MMMSANVTALKQQLEEERKTTDKLQSHMSKADNTLGQLRADLKKRTGNDTKTHPPHHNISHHFSQLFTYPTFSNTCRNNIGHACT